MCVQYKLLWAINANQVHFELSNLIQFQNGNNEYHGLCYDLLYLWLLDLITFKCWNNINEFLENRSRCFSSYFRNMFLFIIQSSWISFRFASISNNDKLNSVVINQLTAWAKILSSLTIAETNIKYLPKRMCWFKWKRRRRNCVSQLIDKTKLFRKK